MSKLLIKYAVYGALPNGNSQNARAFDVMPRLKTIFEFGSTVVAINDENFGDPAPGYLKHFGAVVNCDGTDFYFGCQENQSIDFSHAGGVIARQTMTVLFATYGALPNGSESNAQAFDVTAVVQAMLNQSGGPVACNNTSFGDPSPNNAKHFAAMVFRGGNNHYFACAEGQTIDFSQGGNA